jgi:carbamoyl-phosphate synthase large subunit
LLSVRFAVQGKSVFVLEANLRVSRTTPFVAKATGLQLVELAAQLALGSTLAQQGCTREPALRHVAVKEAVFPFARFPGADVLLGTRMKSTGGVMGLSQSIAEAFGKSQLAAGTALPRGGQVFVSVQNDDKPAVVDLGRRLKAIGFTLLTTEGTHAYLSTKRVESDCVPKVQDGGNHIGERVRTGEIALVINTVDESTQTEEDGFALRREAVTRGVPYFTTVEAARLAVAALEAQATGERQYRPLQDWLAGPQ